METFALDLDEELLAHLPDAQAWTVMQGEGITEELIEDDSIAEIFVWQRNHMRQHGQPATAAVLDEQFGIDFKDPETAVGDLLDRLRERYMKNQGRVVLRGIVEHTFKEDPLAVPQELLRKGRELSVLLSKRGEVYGTGDFDRAMHQYDRKVDQGPGASFGHPILDDYFYGLNGLTFWLAPPKTYKSWMMVQCVAMNALAGRCSWLYSLELPAKETDMRLRCMLAGVPWWKHTRNAISIEERAALKAASEFIDQHGIYRIVKPPHGQRDITEMVNTARDAGAELVVIDQLQYVENGKGESLGSLNKTGEYFNVLDRARTLSDEGPLLVAHQFHRNPGGYESMPSVDHAKGSSSIEEVATLCLGAFANKDMRRSGIIEVGTLIARNAQLASWECEVELSRDTRFTIVCRNDEDNDGS